jgi:hypothetical protein
MFSLWEIIIIIQLVSDNCMEFGVCDSNFVWMYYSSIDTMSLDFLWSSMKKIIFSKDSCVTCECHRAKHVKCVEPCKHVHNLSKYTCVCLVHAFVSCAHASGDRNVNALPGHWKVDVNDTFLWIYGLTFLPPKGPTAWITSMFKYHFIQHNGFWRWWEETFLIQTFISTRRRILCNSLLGFQVTELKAYKAEHLQTLRKTVSIQKDTDTGSARSSTIIGQQHIKKCFPRSEGSQPPQTRLIYKNGIIYCQ